MEEDPSLKPYYKPLSTKHKMEVAKVMFYMNGTIDEKLQHYIEDCAVPYAAWVKLQHTFQPQNSVSEFRIVQKLDEHRFPDITASEMTEHTVEQYLAERSAIKAEAKSLGLILERPTPAQSLRLDLIRLLCRLPSELFGSFLDQVLGRLEKYRSTSELEEELRRWTATRCTLRQDSSATVLNAKVSTASGANRPKCNKSEGGCGKEGHKPADCWSKPENEAKKPAWLLEKEKKQKEKKDKENTTPFVGASVASAENVIYYYMAYIEPEKAVQEVGDVSEDVITFDSNPFDELDHGDSPTFTDTDLDFLATFSNGDAGGIVEETKESKSTRSDKRRGETTDKDVPRERILWPVTSEPRWAKEIRPTSANKQDLPTHHPFGRETLDSQSERKEEVWETPDSISGTPKVFGTPQRKPLHSSPAPSRAARPVEEQTGDLIDLNDDAVDTHVAMTETFQANAASSGYQGCPVFLLDTGASCHLTNQKQYLHNASQKVVEVTFADGDKESTELCGDLLFKFSNQGGHYVLRLEKVLYASWAKNLISVGSMINIKNMTGYMEKGLFNLTSKTLDKTLLFGIDYGTNLYKLQYERLCDTKDVAHLSLAKTGVVQAGESRTGMEWHRSMAHASYGVLQRMVKAGKSPIDMKTLSMSETTIKDCLACAQGKAHLLPFPGKDGRIKYARVGEMVVSDLKTNLGGPRPILHTVIDSASGYLWGFALSHKSGTLQSMKDWHTSVIQRLGIDWTCFRTDNGGEYTGKDFQSWLKSLGVTHQTTVPKTPQQNGRAERWNRTILDKTRSCLVNANLPNNWWAKAVSAMIYVSNRTENSNGIIPWEKLNDKAVDLSNLRPWGCLCVMKDTDAKRFKPSGIQCIFTGYLEHTVGWEVFDPKAKRFHQARDLSWFPDTFPGMGLMTQENVQAIRKLGQDAESDNDYSEHDHDSDETSPGPTPETSRPASSASSVTSGGGTTMWQEAEETMTTPDTPRPAVTRSNHQIVPHVETPAQTNPYAKVYPKRDETGKTRWNDGHDAMMAAMKEEIDMLHCAAGLEDDAQPEELDGISLGVEICIARSVDDEDWPEDMEDEEIPQTYQEAMNSKYSKYFQRAMDEQMATLLAKGVWKLVDRPDGVKEIPGRWVFSVKRCQISRKVTAIKARWVVKGFMQREGIDYSETFSPVAKAASFRIFIIIAGRLGFVTKQGDVKSAFVSADLDGPVVYMVQPWGYHTGLPNVVCMLLKAMWGLCQSPLCFFKKARKAYLSIGFVQVEGDECMFITHRNGSLVMLVLHVDDYLIASTKENVDFYQDKINQEMEIDDRGYVGEGGNAVLGMHMTLTNGTYRVEQGGYIRGMLDRWDQDGSMKPVNTPMEMHKLSTLYNTVDAPVDRIKYLEFVGCAMYLGNTTRPDICWAIGMLARFSACPKTCHWAACMQMLRYLKGTQSLGLTFKIDDKSAPLNMWSDADFAGDVESRKSTSGCAIKMFGCLVYWSSSRQRCITTSTQEAEYVAFAKAAKSTLWILKMMAELDCRVEWPVVTFSDNLAAIKEVQAETSRSTKLRHIDVSYKYVLELSRRKIFTVKYCNTGSMLADIFTKPLNATTHKRLTEALQVLP